MREMLAAEIEDIKASYELLIDGVEIFEVKVKEAYIPYFSIKGDMKKVHEGAEVVEMLTQHLAELQELHRKWRGIIKSDGFEVDVESTEQDLDELDDDRDVSERTTWSLEEDNIRIETRRKNGGNSYPNIIPKHIFAEVANEILNLLKKYDNPYFKKSKIEGLMKDRIIEETNYKKSPGTVVYSVIKVLLVEDLLKKTEQSKRMYTLKKSPKEIEVWLAQNIFRRS